MSSLIGADGKPHGANRPQNSGQPKVDIKSLKSFVCSECENDVFLPVVQFKIMSALISPDCNEQLIPMQVFQCTGCGHIPEEFLP